MMARAFWQNLDTEKHNDQRTDNLELYLHDVYEKECVLKATQNKTEFIQKGIETLVKKIVHLVLENYSLECERRFPNGFCKKIEQIQRSSGEVYFRTRIEYKLEDYVNIKSTRSPIIKVGSFYEGTKNNFPDEFDFIFLLFCSRQRQLFTLEEAAHATIRTVISRNKESLKYVSQFRTSKSRGREIYLDEYVRKHGPASKLQFIYNNGSGEDIYIYVDLVPAFQIKVDKNDEASYAEYVRKCVKPKTFCNKVLRAENYLTVDGNTSFTETEVNFIRNVLSKKHVKVYRILKFLINGHGDGELLSEYLFKRHSEKAYTSYQIKTMMIYHHDKCKNPDTTDAGPCVLQVLEQMNEAENEFPTFSDRPLYKKFFLLPHLKSLAQTLKLMQTSEGSYNYESVRMNSLSEQHLPEDAIDLLFNT